MAQAAAKAKEQDEPPKPVPFDQKEDETERLKKLSSFVDLLMVPKSEIDRKMDGKRPSLPSEILN